MVWPNNHSLQNDDYIIKQQLGQGRYCITYLAKDKNGKEVVIKTLNDDELNLQIKANQLTPEERIKLEAKFLEEAERIRLFQHPHIVKVIDTFREGQQGCIVMEYIPGDTLNRLVKRVLPEPEALRYIRQIGEALSELHKLGWVHRDVKPENIMIRAGKYEAVLIDFDLVRGFNYPLSRHVIAKGFTPLELYGDKRERGAYTDVYALAATLYAVLTGEVPPDAQDLRDGKVQLISPQELNPQISERVNRAILEGMQLEGKNRPQTMQEWLGLLGVKKQISLPLPQSDAMTVWQAIGTLAGVLAAIVALVAYLKPPATPSPSATPVEIPTPSRNK
ncbi:MAG TPA: serine/threonine protein kinase [Cyanobacteria bacterium UBA11372]|nr:serine/threonine protein kinase [Cyanobacteria bacterium UBA11372]